MILVSRMRSSPLRETLLKEKDRASSIDRMPRSPTELIPGHDLGGEDDDQTVDEFFPEKRCDDFGSAFDEE